MVSSLRMTTRRNFRPGFALIIAAGLLIVGALAARDRDAAGPLPKAADEPVASTRIDDVQDGGTYALKAGYVQKEIDGRMNRMMAYNGSIPGPVLRVRQGSTVTVRFTNGLDEPTTVHWHGIRVKNAFDGVPDVTQDPVPPGGEFAYELRFPDPGVYWYHPHVREDKQQDMGLHGNILVMPEEDGYWPKADREEFLVLDDIIASNGFLAPYFDDLTDYALMGRYGNVLLVNGAPSWDVRAAAGEVLRVYVTNVANARPFRVTFPGAAVTLVGSDAGRVAEPNVVDGVTLAPSERAVLHVQWPSAGTYAIAHRTPDRTYRLGTVTVGEGSTAAAVASPSPEDFASIRPHLGKPVDATWKLDVSTAHMMHHASGSGPIEWEDDMRMMNAHMTDQTTEWKIVDAKTGKENMDIMPRWRTGEHVKIRIINDDSTDHPMQHPIHLHGQRFVVAAVDGVPNARLEWKDTVLIAKGSTVDLVVEVSNPGEWMVHCHVAEHLQAGMMTSVMVEGADAVSR